MDWIGLDWIAGQIRQSLLRSKELSRIRVNCAIDFTVHIFQNPAQVNVAFIIIRHIYKGFNAVLIEVRDKAPTDLNGAGSGKKGMSA